MTWIDALLDRLMLLGLGCSLVFGLYLLLRKWQGEKISGRVRRFAWLVVLLLPFLAIPWPAVITVPADAPSWIYAGRLPDLAVPYPDVKRVPTWPAEQRRQLGITQTGHSLSEKTTQTSPVANTRTTEVLLNGPFPWLWYLSRQNLIRNLFLAAVLLLLLVRLYQARKGRRGQGRALLPAVALTSDDWLQDLAQARDTVGLYRRGPLLLLTGKPSIFQSIQLVRRRAILLPEGSDQISDTKNRQALLQQAIIQQRHPDILMLMLYRFEHCWLWLWPVGWLPGQIYQEDRQIRQTEQLASRLARKTANGQATVHETNPSIRDQQLRSRRMRRSIMEKTRQVAGKTVPATAIVILFLALPVLAIWQNPLYLWPDMNDAINKQAAAWTDVNQLNLQHDGVSDTYLLWSSYYGFLTGPGQMTSYIDGPEAGIQLLDQAGQPAWRLRLDDLLIEMWPHPEPDRTNKPSDSDDASDTVPIITIELTGQQKRDDGSYLLTARILHLSWEPQVALLQVSQDGKWLGYALLGDIVSAATGEPFDWTDYSYQTVLMRDGDLVIVRNGVSSAGSADGQPDHEYHLFRIRNGAMLWKLSSDDLQATGLNLYRYEDSSMIRQRSIQQSFPANDGGLFLVISDDLSVLNEAATPVFASKQTFTTYPLTSQIARMKPDGTLDWIMPVGDSEWPVTILDAEHADNGWLYLAAQVQYRQPVLHQSKASSYISSYDNPYENAYTKGSLIVLNGSDGREAWRQDYYTPSWSMAAQVLLQDETVTVLYQYDPYGHQLSRLVKTDAVPPGLSCETICQYDRDGPLTGYAILPKASGQLNWNYIFIRPGFVMLPTATTDTEP